jgi:hypothetical protein
MVLFLSLRVGVWDAKAAVIRILRLEPVFSETVPPEMFCFFGILNPFLFDSLLALRGRLFSWHIISSIEHFVLLSK